MIRFLLYLLASGHDILFSVCLFARFQSDSKQSHLTVVKRILRYLAGTAKLILLYPRDTCFKLMSYNDVDFARSRVRRRSTSGTCQFFENALVSCHGKKHNHLLACQLQRLNTFRLEVVWPKFYGLNISSRNLGFHVIRLRSVTIIQVS